MKRESAAPPAWRQSTGIALTVVGLIALLAVLWQIGRLSAVPGLNAGAVARERLTVSASHAILNAMVATADYRDAVALDTGAPAVERARRNLETAVRGVTAFYGGGEASELDLRAQLSAVKHQYGRFLSAGDSTVVEEGSSFGRRLQTLLDATGDASGLNYDPDQVAQNLADVAISGAPRGYAVASTVQAQALRFIRTRAMSLKERIRLANDLNALRLDFDLNTDRIPEMSAMLARVVPDQRFSAIPSTAERYQDSGRAFYALLSNNFVEAQQSPISERGLNVRARPARDAALRLHAVVASALDAYLSRRGDVELVRQRYIYALYACGVVFLIGIMILIAQLVARRDREALRLAQQESMRLSAELARQEAESALRLSEAQFRALYDGAAIGIAIVDRTGAVVDSNNVFRTMFGEGAADALKGMERDLTALFAGDRETFEIEQHLHNAMGHEIWADVTVSMVSSDEQTAAYAMCMFRDKTQLKHNERRMQYDKLHDSLTGLPNRQLFEQHLRRRFQEATALLDSFFAVLFVDLEHFKDVNESLGHAAGDLVLTQVAQRLRSSVDPGDVVARLGSDEYAVLIQSLGDILHVESVARRILNNVSKTIAIGDQSIYLGARMGIAIGSSAYERAEDVMRDAEVAMQHAKSSGGARHAVFDSKMHQRAQKRLQLTSDIRLALDRNEFHLLYQPIVSLTDGTLTGCEALIRWNHPSEGLLYPGEFMPIAEQSSLAVPVGRFVLQTAMEQLATLRRVSDLRLPFTMHINVSAAELMDPDFERFLVQLAEHHGLPPQDVIIEITESVVLDSATRANVTIERVRNRGFGICIDDFGTGYSSMRYLQQFKVDAIKIDRMFVSGSDGELASEPIVRTLMTLAEAFDVRVVAEGVETPRQRDMLRNAGCRLAQGYLYARPLTAGELVAAFPKVFTKQQTA